MHSQRISTALRLLTFLSGLLLLFLSLVHHKVPTSPQDQDDHQPQSLVIREQEGIHNWGINQDAVKTKLKNETYLHFSSQISQISEITARGGELKKINLDDNGETTVLKDGMLIRIAMEARKEMVKLLVDQRRTKQENHPAVMVAFQAGGHIFLSSSIKKLAGGFVARFSKANSPVCTSLKRCAITGANPGSRDQEENQWNKIHRTGASCGEPAAVHLYWKQFPDWDGGPISKSRIVAVQLNKRNGQIFTVPPCYGTYPEWGCNTFLKDLGIRAIHNIPELPVPGPGHWVVEKKITCLGG